MSEIGLNIGLMWFNNNPKKYWGDVVIEAAEYYEKKYGAEPTLCVVHTSCFKEVEMGVMWTSVFTKNKKYVNVIKSNAILPNHYWIGSETTQTKVISEENDQNG